MTAPGQERQVRSIVRAIAGLMIAGGIILIRFGRDEPAALVRAVTGIVMIGVGCGVWLRMRWARWLALGACFLAIVLACVLPVLLFLLRPSQGFDDVFRVNTLWTVVAFAFGYLGYKGLSYLRSERGRFDYASNDAAHARLLEEKSSAVAYSAAVWLLLLLAAWSIGRGVASVSLANQRSGRSDSAQENNPSNYFDVLHESGTSAHPNQADIIPLGFCRRDKLLKHVIYIAYANVGWNRSLDKTLRFSIGRDIGRLAEFNGPRLTMPEYKQMLLAEFAPDAPQLRGTWFVNFDANNDIPEEDETNNAAQLEIPGHPDGSLALPDCDHSALRLLARDGPTLTTSTVKLPGTLPDLVPLGLCGRGEVYVSVQFTNRGAAARGSFWISQGHGAHDLEVKDRAYHSLGDTDRAYGRNVGLISELIGARGQSAEVAIKLDAMDAIQESDETNNIASARVTRLADGTVDLPDCDVVTARVANHEWIPDEVALQPAFVPLPDLIPLGLCFKDWGAGLTFIQVVYGNIGTVRTPLEFRVSLHDAPVVDTSPYVAKYRVPSPNGIAIADPGLRAADAREQEVVTVDSSNVILEPNDSNNTMRFAIGRRPDGRVNLPECESVRGPASEWIGNMNSSTGPE